MKIGFYDDFRPCIVKPDGVVDVTGQVRALQGASPQILLENLITNWLSFRFRLQDLEQRGPVIPLDQVRLRPPVPRPGKVLCGNANFMEGVRINPPRPLHTFFKSPDAIIGPSETVVLPDFRASIFNHEAELGIVIGKPAHNLNESEALSYIFGYTTAIDVSARAPEEGAADLPGSYGKSFDTFLPIGPAITLADDVGDPNDLRVQYWVNQDLRQDYRTSDMEHSVAYLIAALSHVMTLQPGDLILAGTNHSRLGPLQDGDVGVIEIEKVGRNTHRVEDPLKRTWDPKALRDPAALATRREALKSEPHPGSWPFQPVGGR